MEILLFGAGMIAVGVFLGEILAEAFIDKFF